MNATDFLSGERCIVLPTKSKPRVYLSIGNREMARLSFELYNPFSKKATILKGVTRFLCVYCNWLVKLVMPTVKVAKSYFILFLEKKLDKKLSSSVYLATAKDKVVVQVQDENGIVGYLKYPTSPIGTQRLLNEQKSISMLSTLKLVPEVVLNDVYNGTPFMMLQNLKGSIGQLSQQEYRPILTSLKKDRSFKLVDHPRIINLKDKLKALGLIDILDMLEIVIRSTRTSYFEVFEHGDFAPWNLIKTAKGIVLFDFEYFEERGLEHMDELKYHFQVVNLLHGKKGKALINAVSSKVNIQEFALIFQIFLIKEIVNKNEAKELYDFENSLLKTLMNEEA